MAKYEVYVNLMQDRYYTVEADSKDEAIEQAEDDFIEDFKISKWYKNVVATIIEESKE